MTAPWGVVHDKDVLLWVVDNFVVVLADQLEDGGFLGFEDFLGLDDGSGVALQEVLDQGLDRLGFQFDLVGEFVEGLFGELGQPVLEVLDHVVDGEQRELFLHVQVAGVSAELLGVDADKVQQASVFLGKLGENGSVLFEFFVVVVKQVS